MHWSTVELDPNCSRSITAGLVVDEPYAFACYKDVLREGKCLSTDPGPGTEFEFMHTVLHGMLKIPEIRVVTADDYQSLDAMFIAKEFDIYFSSYQLNPLKQSLYNATPISDWDGPGLLVKEISENANAKLLSTFHWDLWLAILAGTIIAFGFEWLYRRLWIRYPQSQPYDNREEPRILYNILWFNVFGILLGVFSNLIAIDLVAPTEALRLPFTDLNDLGKKLTTQTCQLVMLQDYAEDEDFFPPLVNPTHNKSWAANFRQAYAKKNTPLYVETREKLAEKVLESGAQKCYVGLDYKNLETFYNVRYCKLRMLSFPDDLPLSGYVFYYQNRSCLSRAIDTVMASDSLIAFGPYLRKVYYSTSQPKDCSSFESDVEALYLTLFKLTDCFWLLIGGCGLSLLMLCGEFMHAKIAVRFRTEKGRRQNWKQVWKISNVFKSQISDKKQYDEWRGRAVVMENKVDPYLTVDDHDMRSRARTWHHAAVYPHW